MLRLEAEGLAGNRQGLGIAKKNEVPTISVSDNLIQQACTYVRLCRGLDEILKSNLVQYRARGGSIDGLLDSIATAKDLLWDAVKEYESRAP